MTDVKMSLKQSLTVHADQVRELKQDIMFSESYDELPDGIVASKLLQAIVLLAQAGHLLKETTYYLDGGYEQPKESA